MRMLHQEPSFSQLEVPLVKKGLGTDTVWFGGGRLGAGVAAHEGIERIIYYGRQPLGRSAFFSNGTRSAYAKLFKVYLVVGDKAYRMELNQTHIYPGGYRSSFSVPEEGIEVEHDLVLVNDAIHQTIRVIRNRKKKALRLRLAFHEYLRVNAEGRTWGDWDGKLDPKMWARPIVDELPKEKAAKKSRVVTWFGIVSQKTMTTRLTHSGRRFFETGSFRKGAITVSALFGYDKKAFLKRAADLGRNGVKESDSAIADWKKRLVAFPKLALGNPTVESFFRLSPLVMESLMPADLPGGMRASTATYWVWGWDTLVHCEAYLVAGQHRFLKEALELYHRTADTRQGIGHQFGTSMDLKIAQAPAAQGLYSYALYQYVAYTGDTNVLRQHYAMVLRILELALSSGHRNGLYAGRALFPDYPEFAGHTGHDISIFNNSIFYQAARATEHLAGWMKDAATARKARTIWQGIEKSFHRFWDSTQNYWIDSLDIRDWTPRQSHPSHAILSFSPFAQELVKGREEACARFMAKHHVFANGVRMYPLWDAAFNGDGNQLGQQYQVNDLFFVKTQAQVGRQDLLNKWLGWIEEFWKQNTVPEGVTVEAENEGPLFPDCPGGKQPFGAKAWYMGILGAILGAHFDAGGVTLGPGLDRPVRVEGILYSGRRWVLSTQGKGRYIRKLTVNDVPLMGTQKIPADVLKSKTIRVEIERGTSPVSDLQLISAHGAQLSRWRSERGGFQTKVAFPGSVFVHFAAQRKPSATWNGKPIPVNYDKRSGTAQVLLSSDSHEPAWGILSVKSN